MNTSNKKIKSLFKEALKMFPVPTKALDSNKNAVIMIALKQPYTNLDTAISAF